MAGSRTRRSSRTRTTSLTDHLKLPDGYGRPPEQAGPQGLDLARRLRALTGVDEDLLAWVWYERSKYTALGGVVLGTSVIAAFSMWNFVNEAIGEASVLALLPAVVWLLFVLNLDRWLIAPQPNAKRRPGPLLMRLAVALLLGTVIAEPLVLRIFQTAVEERIQEDRHGDVDRLRGNLLRCNPDPSQPDHGTPAGCGSYLLSFGATPGGQSTELDALRKDAAALQKRVDQDSHALEALDTEVREECRQLIRNASSGLLQRTSECLRLRDKAAEYRSTHHTAENERRLVRMNDRIGQDGSRLTRSRGTFLTARNAEITQRVAQERAKQKGIGVLERMQALEALTADHTALFVGVWMVRLLFVLIDVLPVLVKFMSHENSYDRLLSARSNSAVKVHSAAVHAMERESMADLEIKQEVTDQYVRRRKAESVAAHREHVAAMNIRERQTVDSLEEELRRPSTV
ncbi:DUF4407 domain-containing protein [Streptomyces kasugaensis]|uniref:DUF4407 domain-containing protein n=1 Tax=Streptomyces kasugaensis TaxID=1946 RepID=A0A4Q9HU97_STRKA|nr:DUF4407 domain-containing protein [Streptomyces kasugaensis]